MTEAYTVTYRPDLGILVVRCQPAAGAPPLRDACLQGLETARQHHAARWLLDVRRQPPLCARQTEWLADTLHPLATRWLNPAPLALAVLSVPPAAAAAPTPVAPPPWLRVFADEGAACQWLRR